MIAHPLVQLQDRARKWDLRAREVTGEEKAVWWERCVAAFPEYADYQVKTNREIPVFVLDPVAELPVTSITPVAWAWPARVGSMEADEATVRFTAIHGLKALRGATIDDAQLSLLAPLLASHLGVE